MLAWDTSILWKVLRSKIFTLFTFLMMLFVLTILMGCDKENPSGPNPPDDSTHMSDCQVLSPFQAPKGVSFPLVVRECNNNPRATGISTIALTISETYEEDISVTLRRGAGVKSIQSEGSQVTVAHSNIEQNLTLVPENYSDRTFESEELQGADLIWRAGEVISIEGNVSVPTGSLLMIEPGVLVKMGALSQLHIYGELNASGNQDSLISFLPATPGLAWGEIAGENATMVFEWVLLSGGGGDDNPETWLGHSKSQPVLRTRYGSLNATHLFIVENKGKAFGSEYSVLQIDSSLVARCDTGGEHIRSLVTIDHSFFLEFPNEEVEPVDDDNDASYFNNDWTGDERISNVRNSVFIQGQDDALDQNGAALHVENCVIEGFYHEGVACSNQNNILIENSLILHCGQGIEAGYGSPAVVVNHCLLIKNGVGLRFGDEYTISDHVGTLEVINTISQQNTSYNVLDFDPSIGEATGNIAITYSMVNDSLYNQGTGNLQERAILTEDYLLSNNSPGREAASDGLDIGLLP